MIWLRKKNIHINRNILAFNKFWIWNKRIMFYSYDNLMHFCISVIIFYQTFFSSFLFPSQQDLNTLSIAPTLHSLQVWILAKAKHRMTNHNYWASYNKKCIFRVWIKNLRRVLWLEIIAANIKTLVVLNFDNFLSNKKKEKLVHQIWKDVYLFTDYYTFFNVSKKC